MEINARSVNLASRQLSSHAQVQHLDACLQLQSGATGVVVVGGGAWVSEVTGRFRSDNNRQEEQWEILQCMRMKTDT